MFIKSSILLKLLLLLNLFIFIPLNAQDTPAWTRDINAFPDSTSVFPVRVAHDGKNQILVLSTFHKGTGTPESKIYLKKFDATGGLIWTLVYDNNGNGQPRGFDMTIDQNGYSYIAGGFMAGRSKPLILKISPEGKIIWMRDSCQSFNTGYLEQVKLKNDRLYFRGAGIACFDTSGNELWSKNLPSNHIAVDNKGQVIVSGEDTSGNLLSRYDKKGVRNFTSTFLVGKRIVTDQNNNIYVLADLPKYFLVKYDSSGIFQWSAESFPPPPPFGDIGLEIMVDYNNNVIIAGLGDSLYKLTPNSKLLWGRSMQGMDVYRLASAITFGNHIAIAGSAYNGTDYYLKAATFNLDGIINWSGTYNSSANLQEFTVDFTIDNSGIYVVENNNQNGTLVKFNPFFSREIDYRLVCVDSVWYDPVRPNYINARLFNGNPGHLNYPSVQILDPNGDTISNHSNSVNFFAHMGNYFQTYTDSISKKGISDFSSYTFLVSEGFSDTTVKIQWCNKVGIQNVSSSQGPIRIYPNPFSKSFSIDLNSVTTQKVFFKLYDLTGRTLMQTELTPTQVIYRGDLPSGLYFYTIVSEERVVQTGKILAE